jgi:trk system potassium uptake protein
MHFIVVGCGRVGSELAVRLRHEGHSVVVVDRQRTAFRRLPEGWGGETVVGFGFDQDTLREAGVERADALAAVTSGDNTNILTARVAREMFEVSHVVARIYDPRRAVIYQRLGIPTVATVSWTVDQVMRRLFPERSATAWTDPTGEVSMVERALPHGFAGRRLDDLTAGDRFRPVLVTRRNQARLAMPDLVGQEGDIVLFSVRTDALDELERALDGGEIQSDAGPRRGRGDRQGPPTGPLPSAVTSNEGRR